MSNKFKFTNGRLNRLSPQDKTITYHDTHIPGLKLTVSKAGTFTFMIYRKIKGRPERIKIGNYPTISTEDAQREAQRINGLIAQGFNPNDSVRADRAELTLQNLFDEYLETHSKPHKKSWRYDEMNYKNHLSHWKNKKLSSITSTEVKGLHAKIGKNSGQYQANRVLALLKVMFNKAIDWNMYELANPAQRIKQFKESSRDRFLQSDELHSFFEAVSNEQNEKIRDYILISLLTGARRSNVLAMSWEEISFDRAEWRIPDTKNGTPHIIPLTKLAVEILENRKNSTESDFVFPGTGKSGHLVEPKKGWIRIKERAGIKDLRLHDLRRSLGSWQAMTGASMAIIGKTLAHKDQKTTAIYARLDNDPVRESMEKATEAMMAAGNEFSHKIELL